MTQIKIKYVIFGIVSAFVFLFCTGCGNEGATEPNKSDGGIVQNVTEDDAGIAPGLQKNIPEVLNEKLSYSSLIDNNFVVYIVNCGASNISLPVESTGNAGIGLYDFLNGIDYADSKFPAYQSVSDKVFGPDPVTGMEWGYEERDDITVVSNTDSSEILQSYFSCKEGDCYIPHETGFYYTFRVPDGEYEVICGFNDPFTTRKVDIFFEDEKKLSGEKIYKYEVTELTVTGTVSDGYLNIAVTGNSNDSDEFKRPILTYVIVCAVPDVDTELVLTLLDKVKQNFADAENYKTNTVTALTKAYDEIQEALDIDAETGQPTKNLENKKLKELYINLMNAYKNLEPKTIYRSFKPGDTWLDSDGTFIQAHGGQVQWLTVTDPVSGETNEKWWWVGEDKTNGYRGGINAYSSDDLYNWTFEGTVMRNVISREVLDTDPYFTSLYAGYTSEQLDNVYMCINSTTSVIERPKMVYNEKTGVYVMWFHADGPTETSSANYAAASAGVAVSDSPYGPFRFVDRYRLNVCPDDQTDMYPQSRGMARDMNLFVDDDGTAYIIYSSEENLTLYISKLNEEYTYLATEPENAVYGEDFIRIFPGAQREAPALFKRNGVYYLMTSGCTGWAANQARYAVADSIFGEWVNMGDPCINDLTKTTFTSQSTCIFCAGADTYIYMGDRWFSDTLNDSRYIWLPVTFSDDNKMSIEYKSEWTY